MVFEKTKVFNFEGAFRGMRNPKNSWSKSDSCCCNEVLNLKCSDCDLANCCSFMVNTYGGFLLGNNDLKLAQKLILSGTEHSKFMRQIFVSVDITAPLFWFKEYETYKVGTTSNSTSSMHTITNNPITKDCFELDGLDGSIDCDENEFGRISVKVAMLDHLIPQLEYLRNKYVETKDKRYWNELIRWLPESWLQKRTVTLNYAVLRQMYFQRRNHKLSLWSESFCNWIESLPYSHELIMVENNDKDEEPKEKKHTIFCIEGRTASGKSTIAKRLAKELKLTVLKSYTTRPMRENEINNSDHIFISTQEVEQYKNDIVAYTKIDGYEYFCTSEQLMEADIYVIDYIGIQLLKCNNIKNLNIVTIYIDTRLDYRVGRYLGRKLCKTNTSWSDALEEFISRNKAEESQFNDLESKQDYDFRVDNSADLEVAFEQVQSFVKDKIIC